ncbi:MAG: hypothetical protein CUN49_13890 [Candidatus Thermofonsia Clade 1 bacterium]|uniref:FlgD Ig-like domain-containing protein n=1 Tax=Candidatus Thermofonsia Clade 1 bacterium TaxID=2364210 RepID=A0A2M8PB74_9CHLR|nr:MAG: hypothetical protein CUN49_13890 [Candidatus Thermofonsia Clade 1 bacterium]
MRFSPILLTAAALLAALAVIVASSALIQPNRPLLLEASLSLARLTPNADGIDDVTEIRYALSRTARLSITFTKTDGTRFAFREDVPRTAGTYRVLFSGVVNGFSLPGEQLGGIVERRLMPDGEYTWEIRAEDVQTGAVMSQSGTLILADGTATLPDIQSFEVSPPIFTPNQDGYDDRISINLYLAAPARLTVYLEGADGVRYYIAERFEGRLPDEGGARFFDYDGGVDNNITPPPDGTYRLVALAEDRVGQRVRREGSVAIKASGLPNAEIVAQSSGRTVTWTTLPYDEAYYTDAHTQGKTVAPPIGVQSTMAQIAMPQGDLLVFRLTVLNYGTTPIRTIGPWPGTVYQYDQTDAAMMTPENRDAISGAWRVGVQCERSESSYPWRWALGAPEALTRVERDGEVLWYLQPNQQVTVWGAVRMTRLIPTRNPQKCFAALIHEDVAIPPRQNRVGEIDVRLLPRTSP